jgi:ribose transport system ATP-binding protein
MRGGRVVAEIGRDELASADLYRLMVGETVHDGHFHDELHAPPDEERVRLDVTGLTRAGAFEGVDLQVHAGEVFGLVGVQGSGREALCRALFGAVPIDAGTVTLDGQALQLGSPVEAVRSGIAYLPAERRSEGLLPGMSVTENLTIAHPAEVSTRHLLDPRKEDALARTWIERLRIKTPSPAAQVQTLSGGTQQKVVLARWMVGPDTRLMILDHPTRGLDVGAKSDVYAIIRELAAAGMAVLLMADTLEETIALADRLLVMKDGRSVGLLEAPMGSKPSQVEIVELMV